MDVRKMTTVASLRPVGYLKGRGGLRESETGVHGAPGHSGHLPGVMGNRRTQSRKGTWRSGAALECHPRHEEGKAAWAISGVCSTGPCTWAKWTGFSTLVGSDSCPLSLQRGLWAPLVSQSSGSHCAPVMVQENLGVEGKEKTKGEDSRQSTVSPNQDSPGTTVTGTADPPAFGRCSANPPITPQSRYWVAPLYRWRN